MRPRFIQLIPLLCLATPVAAESKDEPFRVTATIEQRQVSEDGRYAVVGEALLKQETSSVDRRYSLKTTAATCNPADDSLFRNGFENP